MDHAEALEHIEIAAAEPDGLDRLMAGDTPEAAAVAGHLAGCPVCVAELARLRRVSGIARQVIAEAPAPDLRARTLAYVRAYGVERQEPPRIAAARVAPDLHLLPVAPDAPAADVPPAMAEVAPVSEDEPAAPRAPRRAPLAWLAGIAAALLIVGVAGYGLGGGFAPEPPHDDSAGAVMADAATTAMDLAGVPGTQVVRLAATPAGGEASGRLAFNGDSGELVMVASGLADPGDGAVYGCWVEADGERRRIGTMYAAGTGHWAWSGAADGLDGLPEDTVFGVSLVPANSGQGEPVLTGGL